MTSFNHAKKLPTTDDHRICRGTLRTERRRHVGVKCPAIPGGSAARGQTRALSSEPGQQTPPTTLQLAITCGDSRKLPGR